LGIEGKRTFGIDGIAIFGIFGTCFRTAPREPESPQELSASVMPMTATEGTGFMGEIKITFVLSSQSVCSKIIFSTHLADVRAAIDHGAFSVARSFP
jgi:hypothetical protein